MSAEISKKLKIMELSKNGLLLRPAFQSAKSIIS